MYLHLSAPRAARSGNRHFSHLQYILPGRKPFFMYLDNLYRSRYDPQPFLADTEFSTG